MNRLEIGDFRVSVTILREGVNSGQTFIKYRDLACDAETTTVIKLWEFDHEIGSQISFANFVFKFFIHQLSESLKMRKILAHVIGMQKNPQTQAVNFLNFYGLS